MRGNGVTPLSPLRVELLATQNGQDLIRTDDQHIRLDSREHLPGLGMRLVDERSQRVTGASAPIHRVLEFGVQTVRGPKGATEGPHRSDQIRKLCRCSVDRHGETYPSPNPHP